MTIPKILAPAGDTTSFLAAIAAGADAVYCGLKIFSARMEADNFSVDELARLACLAKSRGIQVYVALNSMIKEDELEKVSGILGKLCRFIDPDALIIQDLSLVPLARAAGFKGELHLSTLGNCTFPAGLATAAKLDFTRVVLPREFTIDEIKAMAHSTPAGMDLEVFVHGALCYAVSGRCYWSSWFGGKSALRGRCVQPCRRMYDQKGQKKRFFSCMDFSADVLVKILKQIPQIAALKIEGRKKSPHYVYYTVKAYRLLRDDPKRKNEALAYLNYAMGRKFTHYNLLTQRKMDPLDHQSETASGLFAGRVQHPAEPFFVTREALLPNDLLRIGFEDDPFHEIQRVTRAVPKKGKFYLNKKSRFKVKKATPVYIIDRRGSALEAELAPLQTELSAIETPRVHPVQTDRTIKPLPQAVLPKSNCRTLVLARGKASPAVDRCETGLWMSGTGFAGTGSNRSWHWLDPLIFPEDVPLYEACISRLVKKGSKHFVINAPWQLSLFENPSRLSIWAGPFCNIGNSQAVAQLKQAGCSGVIVSPELDKKTFCELPKNSPLPLGAVLYGNWPLAVSRILSSQIKLNQPIISPKGEVAWASKHRGNYFIYPNWHLDLRPSQKILETAGYSLFVHIYETIPRSVKIKDRPGLWNWNLKLL